MNKGKVDVLLGLQWGDEGKGKVVDVLTPRPEVCAAFHSIRNIPRWKGQYHRERCGVGT